MLLLPQVGSQTPTYTIRQEQAALAERNESARRRVDEVLTARLALEDKSRKAEARIGELQAGMDARLSSLPPSQRAAYGELLGEQAALAAEAKRFDEAIDELDRQLAVQEGELARNPLKQRCGRGGAGGVGRRVVVGVVVVGCKNSTCRLREAGECSDWAVHDGPASPF